jgi:capsular exopolysaccharide synthesis family protein
MEIKTAGRGLADSLMDYRDAIRGLRTVIDLTNLRRPVRSLLFTSANPSEGKSTTAAHLATSIAEIGKKVLLIDADLRRPTVHTNFNLSSDRGLSDVLMGKLPWRDAIIRVGPQELYMMPAGQASRHASDLIGGGISDLLEKVYSDFEMIIIDAPSMLGCPESQQMAALADSVVVVVKARSTTSKELTRTLSALQRARANILGLVINKVTRSDRAAYGFYPSSYADYARR